MNRQQTKHPPARFQVGDRVQMKHGSEGMVFIIVEDRGNIGVGGRRFFTIQDSEDANFAFDFPEDSLDAAVPTNGANDPVSASNAK